MSTYKIILGALMLSSVAVASTPAPTPTSTSTPASSTLVATESPSTVAAAPTQKPSIVPTAPVLNANGYVLMDANTGIIIAHKNMHQRMEPASLTKLMTLYLTSQAIKQGQITLNDKVHISKSAWQTGGSRMFIQEGSDVSVQDLINGVIVASGNDACVALSQFVGGNEATFVDMMNQTAQQLNMVSTHYMDSTGLPNAQHYTTPYDIALLTRALITNFPQDYVWYKQKWITYNNIKQPNRNRLLWRDNSVDGLKTGHTEEAGYCLVASAERDGTRLISIVMGAPTDAARADDSEALLNWGFRFYHSHKLYDAKQALANPRVWLGANKTVPVGLSQPFYVTIPAGNYSQLQPQININTSLKAPIQAGQTVGMLTVKLNNAVINEAPIVALTDNPRGGLFARAWDHVMMVF